MSWPPVRFVALLVLAWVAAGALYGCGASREKTITISAEQLEGEFALNHPRAQRIHCEPLRVVEGSSEFANVPEPSCEWVEGGKHRGEGP